MNTSTIPPWKALRESTGLTQREVGRRAGINSGRMSVIERGLIPTEEESKALRRVLLEAMAQMDGEAAS